MKPQIILTEEEKFIRKIVYYLSHEKQHRIESGYDENIGKGFVKIYFPVPKDCTIDQLQKFFEIEENIYKCLPYFEEHLVIGECPDIKLDFEISEVLDKIVVSKSKNINFKKCYLLYIKYKAKIVD